MRVCWRAEASFREKKRSRAHSRASWPMVTARSMVRASGGADVGEGLLILAGGSGVFPSCPSKVVLEEMGVYEEASNSENLLYPPSAPVRRPTSFTMGREEKPK